MNSSSLLPQIPTDIRAARIGTCFNPLTKTLMSGKIVFAPDRFPAGALNMVHGSAEMRLQANSSTRQCVENSFFALDSQVKIGPWVNLSFNMAISNSEAHQSNSLTCFCSYVYKDMELHLLNPGPDTLFNYATDEFQSCLANVLNAPKETVFQAYLTFVQKFGYGCITKLYLTSGSAFQLTCSQAQSQSACKTKYGAGIGIGIKGYGGSVASEYAKEVLRADSTATLNATAMQLPENTPTREWCVNLMNSLIAKGLEKLSNDPGLINSYTGADPKAPDIPAGTPSDKKLPEKPAAMESIPVQLQKQLMQEDGFNGTWEEYKKKLSDLYAGLSKETVLTETLALIDAPPEAESLLLVPDGHPDELSDKAMPDCAAAWDIGGYLPTGYEFTWWKDMFPQLKSISVMPGATSIYLAKAYIYLMTRLQFAHYMNLLEDISSQITENPSAANDTEAYRNACDALLQEINRTMERKGKYLKADYETSVNRFEATLKRLPYFNSLVIYQTFFKNYDFFDSNLFGFLVTAFDKDQPHNMQHMRFWTPTWRMPCVSPVQNMQMIYQHSMHIYAVVTSKGALRLALFDTSKNAWRRLPDLSQGFHTPRITEQGFSYYNYVNPSPYAYSDLEGYRLYGGGKEILSYLKNGHATGLPMLPAIDIDSILNFSKPEEFEV